MDLRTSEQIHQLATTTFRNIEDILPELKNLISVGKSYQKALQNASLISSQFYHLIGAIGVRISSLPGAVRQLGQGFYQISVAHREAAPVENSWIDSILTDFLGPLEMKITKEAKTYSAVHKIYKQNVAHQQQEVNKQQSILKAHKKKEKKKSSRSNIADTQLLQAYNESLQRLHSIRREGLRKGLLEERKLYCFTMDHICNVLHANTTYHAKSHEVITKGIPDWLAAASEPNELPEESAILLEDPLSPKALKSPTSTSAGDDADAGNLSSGNSQDQDVFVFGASQPALTNARDSVAALKAKSKSNTHNHELDVVTPPADQSNQAVVPEQNVLNSIPGANFLAPALPTTQGKKKPSCRVKGLYQYTTDNVEQLQIQVGDLIDAITEPKDGWQYGKNIATGQKGWFPSHYVQQVWPTSEPQRKTSDQSQIPPPDYD